MAVVSRVEVALETTKAVADAKKFERAMDGVAGATRDVNGRLRDAKGKFLGAGNAASTASGGFGKLAGSLTKAAAAYFTVSQAIQATNKAINESISRASSVRSLELLSSQYGETAKLQEAATSSANKFGLSLTQVNKDLASTYARLRPVGVGLEDIESVFNGFNTAARLSGASASESAGAFRQLAQALGSGVLRGDEFNSIAEQAPGLLIAISKETGQAVGALREYAADGKITADIVIRALKRIETEGAESLAKALDTPAQKLVDLQNATENLNVAFGDLILPAVIGLVEKLTIATEGLTEDIEKTQQAFKFLNTQLQILKPLIEPLEQIVKDLGLEFDEFFLNIAEGVPVVGAVIKQLRLLAKLRDLAAGAQDVTDRQGTDLRPDQGAAVLDFNKINAFRDQLKSEDLLKQTKENGSTTGGAEDLLSKQLKSGAELSKQFQRQIQLREASTDLLRQELQIEFDRQDALAKIAETAELGQQADLNALANKIALLETEEARTENADRLAKIQAKADKDAADAAKRRLEADPGYQMQQQLEKLLDTQNQAAFAAQSMGDAFANAFGDVVTGAKSGQEALAGMLKSIAADFLGMAKKIIAQQLIMILYQTILKALGGPSFNSPAASPGGSAGVAGIGGGGLGDVFGNTSSFGTFAEGGFVNKPTNALIGEGGEPEYVIPESKMRESMSRYSRGSRGGGVIPSDGGSSASGDSGTAVAAAIDVRYTVERINSVDYVTADQFQSGMQSAAAQGAQRGEQNTLKRLQMSGSTRKRVGL